MKIKLFGPYAGPTFNYKAGEVVDVKDEVGWPLVKSRQAEVVKADKPEPKPEAEKKAKPEPKAK
jgi:hypothetical protein